MGKYIKKTKGTDEVVVMEVSQGCLGVRTRARTLALQIDASAGVSKTTAASYLQLRSRRLEKSPFHSKNPPPKPTGQPARRPPLQEPDDSAGCAVSAKLNACVRPGVSSNSALSSKARPLEDESARRAGSLVKPDVESETGVEASMGENMLDADPGYTNIRELTPCNSIRNSETLEAPGSTTRPTIQSENDRRLRSLMNRSIPTAVQMEEFFADAEWQQQRRFTEKYNYDPVNDLPLPGRYEWIRLDP